MCFYLDPVSSDGPSVSSSPPSMARSSSNPRSLWMFEYPLSALHFGQDLSRMSSSPSVPGVRNQRSMQLLHPIMEWQHWLIIMGGTIMPAHIIHWKVALNAQRRPMGTFVDFFTSNSASSFKWILSSWRSSFPSEWWLNISVFAFFGWCSSSSPGPATAYIFRLFCFQNDNSKQLRTRFIESEVKCTKYLNIVCSNSREDSSHDKYAYLLFPDCH